MIRAADTDGRTKVECREHHWAALRARLARCGAAAWRSDDARARYFVLPHLGHGILMVGSLAELDVLADRIEQQYREQRRENVRPETAT